MAAIHTSNNTLLQAATDPIFTGIQHDDTLSGLGTLESPLGCIKDDFTGVSTDNTISGDGLTSPLGVVGINSFTGVITDNNLTGNGYDSALGLNSSVSASTFKAGNTTVTDNSITMSDTYGDTTITPTKIRTWDSMTGGGASVITDGTLSGVGIATDPLGIKNGAVISGQYGSGTLYNSYITYQGQNNSVAKIGLTNYGATPYLQLSNNNDYATLYATDINNMKQAVIIKNSGELWGGEFNRAYSALNSHIGVTLVDATANDGSPTDFNNVYYQSQYYPSYSGISFVTTPQPTFGGANLRYIDYTSAGVQDSGTKFLLGGETLSHVTMTFNDTANFNLPWAGMSFWGQKENVRSITFVMPSNYSFESGKIELKNNHGNSYYLTAESGCWYTVSKVYTDNSDMTKFSWQLLNSGYSTPL